MYPPGSKLTRLVDATVEPITVAIAANYLRLDVVSDADALDIADYITAARITCENECSASFITTTWQLTIDSLPFGQAGGFVGPALLGLNTWGNHRREGYGGITLPMPPLISVTSVDYIDQAGASQSLDVTPEAGKVIVSPGTPGLIYAAYGTFFPFTQPRPAAVRITYTAGFGPDASFVPKNVGMAIRMLVALYYEHRSIDAPIPQAVANLLNSSTWGRYA